MAEPVLSVLEPDSVHVHQDALRPFLTNACARSHGRYSPATIFNLARQGLWQIWVIRENGEIVFVGGTEVVVYHTGLKVFCIRFGAGAGRKGWQHHMSNVLAWGKAQGCTRAEGNFRVGWRRVFPSWEFTHVHLEIAL